MPDDPEATRDVGPLRVPPALTELTRPFWTGGQHGELLVQHCQDCGWWQHPPGPLCSRCRSRCIAPRPASGVGVVASFTVNHQQWNPVGRAAPYVVALVELTEQVGLRLLTNVIGCPSDDVSIGMPVQVTFAQLEDVWLPLFQPRQSLDELPTA